MRPRALPLIGSVVVLIGSTFAPAWAAWGPTAVLSPAGSNALELRVAAAKNGDAVAAWTIGSTNRAKVQVARKPAGKPWSAPRTVSAPAGARELQVAADARGRACAVWTVGSSANPNVQVACLRPGVGWGATTTLTPGDAAGSQPRVVVRNDVATVVWTSLGRRIQVTHRVGRGSWSAVRSLSPKGPAALAPDVGADAAGRATVVWSQGPTLGPGKIVSRRETPSGWQSPQVVSPLGQVGQNPRVAVVDDATALVVWVADPLTDPQVWSAHRAGGAVWDAAVAVSPDGVAARRPEVAANRTDDVFAVVWVGSPSSDIVQEVRRHGDGTWSLVHQVSTPAAIAVFDPDVSLNDQQTASVVWQEHDGAQYRAAVAEQNILDSWEPTTYVDVATSNGAYSPQVAATTYPIMVVWRRYDATNHLRVEARRFDPRT